MKEHPINGILKTSLENISELVDVNKVIGNPIVLPNDVIAIPVSKVICGYGVGGSEFEMKNNKFKSETSSELFPFGGASGGGLTIAPISLILINKDKIKLINVEEKSDILPTIFNTIKEIVKK